VGEKSGDEGNLQYGIDTDSAKEQLEVQNLEKLAPILRQLGKSLESSLVAQTDVPHESRGVPQESPLYTVDREEVQARIFSAQKRPAMKAQFTPKDKGKQNALISCVSSCYPIKKYMV
jgi:hypothetical protein